MNDFGTDHVLRLLHAEALRLNDAPPADVRVATMYRNRCDRVAAEMERQLERVDPELCGAVTLRADVLQRWLKLLRGER